jgi:hypothetical protein
MPWPERGELLIPGINDTWNEFQKHSKGKSVSSADWKLAKEILYKEYEEHLAKGGTAEGITDDWCRLKRRFSLLFLFDAL